MTRFHRYSPGLVAVIGLSAFACSGGETPDPAPTPAAASASAPASEPAPGLVTVILRPYAEWQTRLNDLRDANDQPYSVGTRLRFACTPGGTAGPVWGTDVYTDDSSACTAAVHAGLISFDRGGVVVLEVRGGQDEYSSSNRNGVASGSWGQWGGSFVFVGPEKTRK